MGSVIELSEQSDDLFVDPFLLTIALICTIVLFLMNIYFLAHYSHHADGGFGSSSATKFVIVSFYLDLE